jgi:hypothetical protein
MELVIAVSAKDRSFGKGQGSPCRQMDLPNSENCSNSPSGCTRVNKGGLVERDDAAIQIRATPRFGSGRHGTRHDAKSDGRKR